MSSPSIRIATRRSPLALWQAEHVRRRLQDAHPDLEVELVRMTTRGDRILDAPLARVGGKGLFVKELEHAMLEDRADIAVHSMKDVPVELPDRLHLSVTLAREDPRDAYVSVHYPDPQMLPEGARVGTSSLRRQCQLRSGRPDLCISDLRGNVDTRLRKLDEGDVDAIILASAGLIRLGKEARISQRLEPGISLPAIGQGAIGIECRRDDSLVNELIAGLDDTGTRLCISAERAMNARLHGGCQVPIAGYAVLDGDTLWLRGLVGRPDGTRIIRGELRGPGTGAEELGAALAEDLLARGAGDILAELGVLPAGDA